MSIIPQTWQQLVYDADFVGIIECETAGNLVAKYRVVDSWKGPPVGTRLTLCSPNIPLALVGDRFLVTIRQIEPNFVIPTGLVALPGGGSSLAWRRIPADYRTPMYQGMVKLPLDDARGRLWAFDTPQADLDTFRASVDSMLALPPAGQEAAVLHSVSDFYLSRMTETGDSANASEISNRLSGADAAGIVRVWLDVFRERPHGGVQGPFGVLPAGGPITLALLEADAKGKPPTADIPGYPIKRIRIRLRLASEDAFSDESRADTVYADARFLHMAPTDPAFFQTFRHAFQGLCASQPRVIADYLAEWPPPDSRLYGADWAFAMGSYYGWKCGSDRLANFTRLLQARDPYVRAAAAIYLRFEDEKAGFKALKNLASLPGDPGLWVALTLARHGYKEHVPRLIESLRTPGTGLLLGMQQQFLVLLSNSAQGSGIPPVGIWSDGSPQTSESAGKLYYQTRDWWAHNASKITLHDPWLAILKPLTVD